MTPTRRRQLTLLVNPSSGRGKARRKLPGVVSALGQAFPDADVLVRLSTDTRTKTYAAKLRAAGKSKKDVLRCLKRAIAREAWHLLVHPTPAPRTDDLRTLRHQRGLTLTQVAQHLSTAPTRISELERGTRPDILLSNAYREYLTAA